MTITVKKPDATTQVYSSLAHDGTGLYHQDIPPTDITQLGHYSYYVTATVGSFVAVLPSGSFEVFDPLEISVLPLQDGKDVLNIPQTTTTYDAEIQSLIDTIGASIERMTGGPLVNRSITERVDISDSPWEIRVLKRPVVSITSATDIATGLALDLSDADLDGNAGILRRKSGLSYFSTSGVFTVVYVAGWGLAVLPSFNWASRIILQHIWAETQRGGSTLPAFGSTGGDVTMPGMGYAIPNEAAELLSPYARTGGIA